MKNWLKLGALLALSCAVASASSITYTEQQTGTGSLNGVDFTDALVTVTLVGDTANITADGPGFFFNPGAGTVLIEGLGSATFTDDMNVFALQNGSVGIEDETLSRDVLDTQNSAVGTYALAGPFGPLSGVALGNPDQAFPTTAGDFILGSSATGNSTFTASVSSVPEPASLGLIGLGLTGLWTIRRRSA